MKKRFTAGVLLAIFTFLFLETEYLFVNIMGTLSNSRQAVSAQGIVLGVSVIGFVLYALFHRIKSAFVKRVVTVMFPLIMAVCLFFLYEADSYAICLFVGCVVFVLLGLFGSALHYHALFYVGRDSHLALLVGVAYALGLLFQFICNNLCSQPDGTVDFCIYSFCRHGLLSAHTKGSSGVRACGQGGKTEENNRIYIGFMCFVYDDDFCGIG